MGKLISLALSSGGARGLVHIGVIEEIEARGHTIAAIAGSSMGSLVGGIYALGTMQQYKSWVIGLSKLDILGLIDFTLSSYGFIKGEKVFAEMKSMGLLPDANIEDLPIPLTIVATNLLASKEVIYRSGSIYNAIRASVSIPNVFTAIKTSNTLLVDGGVLNPLPVNHLHRIDGSTTVAVDINAPIPFARGEKTTPSKSNNVRSEEGFIEVMRHRIDDLFGGVSRSKRAKEEKIGYIDIFTRTIQLMQSRLSQHTLDKYPPDVLISFSKEMCGIFEFYKAEELIEIGRAECARVLNDAGL